MPEPVPLVLNDQLAGIISRALGFFPEFSADFAAKLLPRSGLFGYPDHYRLIEQGDTSRDIFIICQGRVDVNQSFGSAAASLATLGPGDLLGEIALLRDGVRSATAVVIGEARIFRIVFEDIEYVLANYPDLADKLRALAKARLGLQ